MRCQCQLVVAVIAFAGQTVLAQQVIQQPVVGTSSVSTTVSVPDRGTMFLGGVSSAQFGRTQFNPRSGTSTGLSVQSSAMTASVFIHDFQAMDEALLNAGRAMNQDRHADTERLVSRRDVVSIPEPSPPDTPSPQEKVIKFEELARQAEKSGKSGVAKLHWQMAAKYGSKTATKRLAELNSPPSSSALARSTGR